MWKRRRELRRLRSSLLSSVALVREQLDAERRRQPGQRATGAPNPTLLDAVERAEAGWQRLSWSDDVAAALELRGMAAAAEAWSPGADLTRLVREVGRSAEEVLDRHPDDPRVSAPPVRAELHPRDPRLEPGPPPTSELLLPDAQDFPTVIDLLESGDGPGAVKEYRARTRVGLRDAQSAVDWAARRRGLPGTGR